MFNFFKKAEKIEFALEPLAEQCIPYACHYDDYNLLTKNGELMQVIKIEGYSKEMISSEENIDLRTIIRKAITDNIKDRKVAIWFHTIRRKRNLDSINYYPWTFAKDTHDAWAKKNYWRDKFVNELYVTILYDGENYNTSKNISLSFIPKMLKRNHLDKLTYNAEYLNNIILKMLDVLKVFGGKRLGVVHDRFGAHSEILEFLTKIICLQSKRVALPVQGIDRIFCRSKVAFGGNALEVFDENEKRYAAMFSLKEYHEFAAKALDKFLRISTEYVISQTLNFVNSANAKNSFEYFNYVLGVSKDENLRNSCGLKDTMDSDSGSPTDYGSQQMMVMIIGESLDDLQRAVDSVVKEIHKLGIVIIREDLNIALSFWSQLPGNFSFFRRPSYINTRRTAGFASLHNTPSGETENIWGSAITLFRRADGAPHFFNLHVANNGHTMILGPIDSAKAILLNFLLSESSKYEPNVLYIDQFETSRVTIKALGGKHKIISLTEDQSSFSLNPFALADSPENEKFLKNWLLLVIFPDGIFDEKQKNIVSNALDKFLVKVPAGKRQISMLINYIEDEAIKASLSLWCKPNKFGSLFDNSNDEFDSGAKMLGLSIAELVKADNSISVAPFMAYCLYRYGQTLNKTPTIIAIHDANQLLADKSFAEFLPDWLEKLQKNNAIAILAFEVKNAKDAIHSNIAAINNKMATHLFLPFANPEAYSEALQLSEEEVKAIKNMKLIYRHFMIKQKRINIVVELNLDGLDYTIKALSGKADAISAMDKAIAEVGDNPNSWIIPFYKNLFPEMH